MVPGNTGRFFMTKHVHCNGDKSVRAAIKFALGAACGAVLSTSAFAWDGAVTGKITRLDGVGGISGAPGNHDLRVALDNLSPVCTGAADTTWAYVNSNDANYKGLMALLLTAYMAGKSVTIYSNKSTTGYCQIGYVSIS
jgi:hypothetical protein